MTRDELNKLRAKLPLSAACLARNKPASDDLVSNPKRQQDSVDEPVAAIPGEAPRQGRVRIVVTSYRCRLLDDDNLALGAKALVDSIVAAGIIPSDSPIWCKIEHEQKQIDHPAFERTEILLENL